jgi:hypothetical protein
MIFGERKKFINISTEFPPWVWIAAKGHIMVIALVVYFSTIGIAIATPGSVKRFPTISWDEGVKLCNSSLQFRKIFAENCVNVIISWPFGWQWVYSGESVKDDGAKLCRSGVSSLQLSNTEYCPNANGSNQHSENSNNVLGWHFIALLCFPLVGLIPLLIALAEALSG